MLALAEEVDRKKLKVGVGLMVRHCKGRQELHARIQQGEIGDLMLLRGHRMGGAAGTAGARPADRSELLYQVQRFHAFLWAGGGLFSFSASGQAPVNAPGRAGFRDDHLGQLGQTRLEAVPNPTGDVLACRVVQTRHLVQIPVIQLLEERLEPLRDLGVVDEPSQVGIALARHGDLGAETVPVKTPALVRLGQARQEMSGFKLKGLSQFNVPRNILTSATAIPNRST